MKRPLHIFGASALARLACFAAEDDGAFDVVGFVVDDALALDSHFMDRPVLRWSDALTRLMPSKTAMFCAIGYRNMRGRAAAFMRLADAGFDLVSLVAPEAHVSRRAHVGPNSLVMSGAVIEPGVHLGSNNVLWSNVTVCHDTAIGSHNFLAAGATLGGHVSVGDRNFVGFGSVVRERQRVGNDTLIGAQSLLLEDALDQGIYFGSPARRVKDLDPALGVILE